MRTSLGREIDRLNGMREKEREEESEKDMFKHEPRESVE